MPTLLSGSSNGDSRYVPYLGLVPHSGAVCPPKAHGSYGTHLLGRGGAKRISFPVIIKDIVAENKKVEYHAAIAVQQHDLVVDQFGANAWDNVSYTLKEIEPVDGELGYRVKSTGKLVDKAEYEEILYEYWGNVAAQEGTSYADIFLTEGEPSENIANKRVDIIAKYSHDIPVELVTVSDSQTYEVFLSFNSKTISADGYEDFHFVIDNEDGEWKVFQGLSWAEPYPENPTGD